MTRLKEWLENVEFENLIPSLIHQDPEAKNSLMEYKMAFDRLRHTIPAEDDGIKYPFQKTFA